ncbi:MAG TPA: cytochrome c3 family protein, partial [Nitrospiria bacterium]|nr:cytochrome c3 family protein [Nitrospiria bacterium]
NLSQSQYILYDQVWSKSFDGKLNRGAPTGYSRLCLSCHDETVAIGSVLNKPGSGGYNAPGTFTNPFNMVYQGGDVYGGGPNQDPSSYGFPAGTMPVGSGALSQDTRRLGTDLTNDHPISFLFDSALAATDTELVDPGPPLQRAPGVVVTSPTPISPAARYPGDNPTIYDSVQCTSCHNPHQVDYPKFLRGSIFQNDPNHPGEQIICLYCHAKPGWVGSTHQISKAVHNAYPDSTNPFDYDGTHTVEQFACRNCHDPHTVQGAKRIHREGVDPTGQDAVEKTCFLCHSPANSPVNGTLTANGNPLSQISPYPTNDPTAPANPRFSGAKPAPDINSQFSKDINPTGQTGCYTTWNPQANTPGPGNFPECGSAMNLTLGHGGKHEPMFVTHPQEGVELGSPSPPANNEAMPGALVPDRVPHVTCTDCHNPHQVEPANRLKGMKGIDLNGLVVGHGVPGNDREPYVYEVCFRCHGNSYTRIFAGDRFPDDTVTRSDPRDLRPLNPDFSLRGFSNKRKEFSPNTPDMAPDHSQQFVNASYHPVGVPGRNGTSQICKQLSEAFHLNCGDPAAALRNLTIQCTDCHNNEKVSLVKGPVTESNLRATDVLSNFLTIKATLTPYEPVGPHGSTFIRILRNRYNTDIQNPLRCFEGIDQTGFGNPPGCATSDGATGLGYDQTGANAKRIHWDNFLLCFQCHDRRAFDPSEPGSDRQDLGWSNFFGDKALNSASSDEGWRGNLHMYHLEYTGAMCHECHYNVHSNVEATNTQYGDGLGHRADVDVAICNPVTSPPTSYPCLPPDGEDGFNDGVVDTHLINFSPKVEGTIYTKPRWAYDAVNKQFQCFLRCHNEIMNQCHYGATNGGSMHWCAGGTTRG